MLNSGREGYLEAGWVSIKLTFQKTNMTIENYPFQKMYLVSKDADFPLSC